MFSRRKLLNLTVFLTLIALSHAADPALNLCPQDLAVKVGTSKYTWAEVLATTIKTFQGVPYLRPDVGQSTAYPSLLRFTDA